MVNSSEVVKTDHKDEFNNHKKTKQITRNRPYPLQFFLVARLVLLV